MNSRNVLMSLGLGLSIGMACVAQAESGLSREHPVRHVLLISVDGLHALDLANYVAYHRIRPLLR